MALPKPLSQRPTGMPQMRKRSGLRTASGNLQEAYLERVRAVRDDPLLVLPDVVGAEPKEIARLREGLEKAKEGKLGFFARRDKGVLGAAWACRKLSDRKAVPHLLDARIDGERRFFLPVGHIRKPACLGVQNWDDPATLLTAYDDLAAEGLHFFAVPGLWCTGREAALVPEWVEAFGERIKAELGLDGTTARCPHADRAALAHVVGPGVELLLCRACGSEDAGRALNARLRNPGGRRPYALQVVLPDGTRADVGAEADALYRIGSQPGAVLIDAAVAKWHGRLGKGYAIADRLFADQEAFLDAVEAPAWMRPALAAMTRDGHAGPSSVLHDVLATHRDRLADGIRALGADPAAIAARAGNADDGAVLRLAHEQAGRAAKTADLPVLREAGPIGAWVDAFVRSLRTDGSVAALQKVRREASRLQHKAHVAAFIAAAGSDPAVGTGFTFDQNEAGRHMAPLAKRVLESSGAGYLEALRAYLAETGSGESVG